MKACETIDEYIANFEKETQALLVVMRETIRKSAPKATEAIKYAIPTFVLNGNLVHFGGYEKHIGFYPGSEAIEIFKNELSKYKTTKGTVQFPYGTPLPLSLITKIVKYRVRRTSEKK